MAWIKKRSGKYLVEWRTIDGRPASRACPNASSARALKLDVEEARARGRDWQQQVTGAEPDLEKVTEAFIAHRARRLRGRTLHRYGENLDLLIRFVRTQQARGKLLVSLLSKPLLEDYYEWLCRAENGLHRRARSPDTARKILEVAQLCWEWADGSERWPGEIPRPRRIEMYRSEPAPVVAPTWAEMDACVLACKGWHQKLVIFLRYSGLRVGESMLLTWSDVDMEAGTLTLRKEIIKSGPGRTVPLSPHLLEEIATWGVREGWLIPTRRHKGERERQARARDISRAWGRAGVRDVVWKRRPDHAFRKGFKSGLLSLRAREDAIDYLQGHTLGAGSARGRYIDPAMLHLPETVALIPKIGASRANVLEIRGAAAPKPVADQERTTPMRQTAKNR